MGALIRRCRAIEATLPPPREALVIERGGRLSPRRNLQTPLTRAIGAINGFAGNYVAYWSVLAVAAYRSEEHTSELQSLMRSSYAVFCLKKKNNNTQMQIKIY